MHQIDEKNDFSDVVEGEPSRNSSLEGFQKEKKKRRN